MASLWFCQAAAGSTAYILTSAFLPACEWRGVDLAATALNVSGSALAGLMKGRRKEDKTADMQAAEAIFMSGFLSVWTSLAFTMEHAAHLAVVRTMWWGLAYLLGSVLLGTWTYIVFHHIGKRWRVSRKAMNWAQRGPLVTFSGWESQVLLATVLAVSWGGWMAGQPADRLGWGIVMAISGGMVGNWFSALNGGSEGPIIWGDWRCNTLSFAVAVSASRYVANLDPDDRDFVMGSAIFQALVSEWCGTVSGFSDLSAGAGDLTLNGDYRGAAANIALNVATAGVALLARMKAEVVFVEAG